MNLTFLLLNFLVCAVSAFGNVVSAHSSDIPIFSAGAQLTFRLPAENDIEYSCKDYWGNEVCTGFVQNIDGVSNISIQRLEPGWYEITWNSHSKQERMSFGVVLNRGEIALDPEGRVGVDAASAWLVHDDLQRPRLAHMLHIAGIPWVRERISWSDTEPRKGEFDWSRYQATVDAFAAEGINICEVWHDSPAWTRSNGSKNNTPADLRDVYRWTKEASAHFRSQVQAWEVWNEMDIPPFWSELGDRYAATLKAAYWGLKDGNPSVTIVMGALATIPPGNFAASFYESGGADYSDRFNWHIYTPPSTYAAAFGLHRAMQSQKGAKQSPAWVTEAGVLISGKLGVEHRELDTEGCRNQAQYIGQSIASSLAAGNERHFFFVLPEFVENGVQFGCLKSDLTPNPSFVVLSASANLLGSSQYLGEWPTSPGIHAYAFRTPNETILAIWSESQSQISVPTTNKKLSIYNLFGARREVKAENGSCSIPVGPEISYILDTNSATILDLLQPEASAPPKDNRKLSRIVVTGSPHLRIAKESNTYKAGGPSDPMRFDIEVYNLSDKKSQSGSLCIDVPQTWTQSDNNFECSVDAFGMYTRNVDLLPDEMTASDTRTIYVRGCFPGEEVAPSASFIQRDVDALSPEAVQSIDWLPARKWIPEAAPNGKVEVLDIHGGVSIEAHFSGSGDRWAYPVLEFDPTLDLSGFDGITFSLEADSPSPNSWVRLLATESSGATYMTGTQEFGTRRKVTLLFSDMKHMGFSKADRNGHLDMDDIRSFKLGLNTPGDFAKLKITDLRIVKYPKSGGTTPKTK